ncbi:hypothetical protein CL689_02900 [Candidatus Saccharibacteria bacterium]|nr:hypothetical protein [Candidatus Saccharibacteria bacterium]|tara:strand:- start:1396 stop:1578 length:183 start_codon:yes stop_codon:yes gene_type:complete
MSRAIQPEEGLALLRELSCPDNEEGNETCLTRLIFFTIFHALKISRAMQLIKNKIMFLKS